MNRKNFITLLSGGIAMASIQPFYDWTKGLGEEEEKMPVLFIGHGSPMNAIEDKCSRIECLSFHFTVI